MSSTSDLPPAPSSSQERTSSPPIAHLDSEQTNEWSNQTLLLRHHEYLGITREETANRPLTDPTNRKYNHEFLNHRIRFIPGISRSNYHSGSTGFWEDILEATIAVHWPFHAKGWEFVWSIRHIAKTYKIDFEIVAEEVNFLYDGVLYKIIDPEIGFYAHKITEVIDNTKWSGFEDLKVWIYCKKHKEELNNVLMPTSMEIFEKLEGGKHTRADKASLMPTSTEILEKLEGDRHTRAESDEVKQWLSAHRDEVEKADVEMSKAFMDIGRPEELTIAT